MNPFQDVGAPALSADRVGHLSPTDPGPRPAGAPPPLNWSAPSRAISLEQRLDLINDLSLGQLDVEDD